MKDAFTIKNFDRKKSGKKHIIFICDHASNYIPKKFKNLGLSSDHLKSHISWDIGAKEFCVGIAKYLRQSCFLSNFSRLLIDPNRNLNSSELILENSCGIRVPGNIDLNLREKQKRLVDFHSNYHNSLGKFVKKKEKKYKELSLVAIHSFTKNYLEINRGVEIGLLWNKNMKMLLPIQKELTKKKIFFGRNYPYSGFFYNYTLDRHSQKGVLNNISLEIRNDLLCNKKRINKYIHLFSEVLREFVYD